MLDLNTLFKSDIDSKTLNLVPLVRITKGETLYVSTNSIEFDGNYYSPILLNIPSLKESVNFESRKYTISSVDLQLSNFPFEGDRLSDADDLINAEVEMRWKSQSCEVWNDCLKVFIGKVRNVKTSSDNLTLSVEDVSQENLHRDLPTTKLPQTEDVLDKYKNKPIPMVYGHVDRSPLVFIDQYKTLKAESHEIEFFEQGNIFGENDDPLFMDVGHRINVRKQRAGATAQYIINEDGNTLSFTKILTPPNSDEERDEPYLECYDNSKEYSVTLSNIRETELENKESNYFGEVKGISDGLYSLNEISWNGYRRIGVNTDPEVEKLTDVVLLYDSNDGYLAIDFRTVYKYLTTDVEALMLKLFINFAPNYDHIKIKHNGEEHTTQLWGIAVNGVLWKADGLHMSPFMRYYQQSLLPQYGFPIHTNSDDSDFGGSNAANDFDDAIGQLSEGSKDYFDYHDLSQLPSEQFNIVNNLINFKNTRWGSEGSNYQDSWEGEGNNPSAAINYEVTHQVIDEDNQIAKISASVNGNFSELDLIRRVHATNVIDKDFYANVKGRWDESGAYTDYGLTGRTTRTERDVQEVLVNPIDEDTINEIQFHPNKWHTEPYISNEGSWDGNSHLVLEPNTTNWSSKYLIKFRGEISCHWDNFVSITFWRKASHQVNFGSGYMRIALGDPYGDIYPLSIQSNSYIGGGRVHATFFHDVDELEGNNTYWTSFTITKELMEEWGNVTLAGYFGTIRGVALSCAMKSPKIEHIDYITVQATEFDGLPDDDDDDDTPVEDIEGCTDPEANNYNPDATIENNTCVYTSSPTIQYVPLIGNAEDSHYMYDGVRYYSTEGLDSTQLGQVIPNENNETVVIIDFEGTQSAYNNNESLATLESYLNQNIEFVVFPNYQNIIFNNNINITGSVVILTDSENQSDNPRIGIIVRAGEDYGQTSLITIRANVIDNTPQGNITHVEMTIAMEAHYPPPVLGCTDSNACNYNADATENDGSCTYATPGYDCDGNPINYGCQNPNAENYDPNANVGSDDEYCIFLDTDGDGVPDYQEIPGCTDPLALNYNEYATDDNGSCEYEPPPELGDDADIEFIDADGNYQYLDTDVLIKNPADIIHHLVKEEIGVNREVNTIEAKAARDYHKFRFFNEGIDAPAAGGWNFGFTIDKKINSKKLIEEIAKSTKLFPKFRNDGKFGFSYIKDLYSLAHIESQVNGNQDIKELIKNEDIISYKFSKSPLEQVYTRVKVLYKKDYADGDLKKDTDWLLVNDLFPNYQNLHRDYYGLDIEEYNDEDNTYKGGQELVFESEYIRHEGTAKALRHFLLGWYKEQHNIVELKLPLNYIGLEIGDTITFNEMIEDVKINSEDYSRNYVLNNKGTPIGSDPYPYYIQRNGQVIYPIWFITETKKNIDSIQIKAIQLHDWTASRPSIMGASNDTRVSGAYFAISNIESHSYNGRGVLSNNIGKLGKTTFELEHYQEGNYEWIFEGNDLEYTIKNDEDGITKVIFNNATGNYPYHVNVTLSSDKGSTTKHIKLYKLGDVNGDGNVGLKDVKFLSNILLDKKNTNNDTMFLADINEDGIVGSSDLVSLQEKLDV